MDFRGKSSCVLLAALLLFAAGCAQLPTEEVRRYANTWEQVRGISEALVDDYAASRAEVNRLTDKRAPRRFEPDFKPRQFLAAAKRQDDIEHRRAALKAVSAYNQALLDLAEGKGVESAKATAGTVVGLVSIFTGPLGIAVGLVEKVAGAVANAHSQGEIIRAYRLAVQDPTCPSAAGPTPTGAAASTPAPSTSVAVSTTGTPTAAVPAVPRICLPLIPAIFSFLIDDSSTFYTQRYTLADERINQLTGSNVGVFTSRIETLTGNFAPPAPAAAQGAEYLAFVAEYRQLTTQLMGTPRNFRIGNAPYDAAAHTELTATMTGLRQLAAHEQKIINELNAYYARLIDYVQLLEKTNTYVEAIGTALEQPTNVDALSGKIIEAGGVLRHDSSDLRGAFRKLLASD